jgi:hypothetical protein
MMERIYYEYQGKPVLAVCSCYPLIYSKLVLLKNRVKPRWIVSPKHLFGSYFGKFQISIWLFSLYNKRGQTEARHRFFAAPLAKY